MAWGDERRADFITLMRKVVAERGLPEPELPDPEPLRAAPLLDVDLDGFGAVILTAGYRPDYARWVDVPGAFDALGFPLHEAGQSTAAPGLWFAGVHFLRRRRSALLCGSGTTPRWSPAGSPRPHSAAPRSQSRRQVVAVCGTGMPDSHGRTLPNWTSSP